LQIKKALTEKGNDVSEKENEVWNREFLKKNQNLHSRDLLQVDECPWKPVATF
jgi:hypothetical protein